MRTRTKVIFSVVFIIAALVILSYRTYLSLQTEVWAEEDAAVRAAMDQSVVSVVYKTQPFVGERPYTIIFGADTQGRGVVVWKSETETHTEFADSGVSEDDVRKKVLEKNPQAQIQRVTPGKLESTYCWQVFYKLKEDGELLPYYDFYSFRDGALLDTWRLSLQ